MSKKKKKKNKNKGSVMSTVVENSSLSNNISNQVIQNAVESHTQVEDPAIALAHRAIRKDLIRILIISLVMLIILAGGVVIRSQTSWISRSADWIYGWMRLGE